jgi:hypothetical protein
MKLKTFLLPQLLRQTAAAQPKRSSKVFLIIIFLVLIALIVTSVKKIKEVSR